MVHPGSLNDPSVPPVATRQFEHRETVGSTLPERSQLAHLIAQVIGQLGLQATFEDRPLHSGKNAPPPGMLGRPPSGSTGPRPSDGPGSGCPR